ncbi:MAG: hypothetical protein IJ710_08680 [Prevotella sp.]|nr:hypothetical protein [Prevotella sp.]
MISIPDIKTSINNRLILDEFIRKGKFEKDPRGRLKMFTGGFTVVFPTIVNSEKWGFRCWHNDLGNLRSHFEILSAEFKKINCPYFCDFDYTDEGIIVNGLKYPTTRMRWVDGQDIKQFICEHRTEKQRLKRLAARFLTMAQTLHQYGIAHGDLQHGNILVDGNDNLFLIDYDSVYLPALKGQADIIAGLKGYQHPKRSKNINASEKLDYFSELIIYTSIIGVAEKPDLAEKYNLEDAEQMLFSPDDFADIEHSAIFEDLSALKGLFPNLLNILKQYLAEDDINHLEPFDVLMAQLYPAPKILYFKPERGPKVVVGTEEKIVWAVEDASELYLNGQPLEVYQKSHQERFDSLGTKHFELIAINGLVQEKVSLDIEAVDGAIVSFSANTIKLRRGQNEQATLQWEIENAQSALLTFGNTEKVIQARDSLIVSPADTTTYRISATAKDGPKVTTEELTILVIDASQVQFEADKVYSLPSVPITLTWNVEYAHNVKLNNELVKHSGRKVVEIEKDTVFTLTVEDEFGIVDHPLTIQMLPLPFVRSVLVPTPNIRKNINVINKVPRPNINISLSPIAMEEPRFSLEEPQFVGTPSILQKSPEVPTGILYRLGTVWKKIEGNIVERLKIY